ncbi:MAG: ribonuclease III domain-containing protein [Methanomassiliicoccaceae archaeon]|nr:ribonuclease III domain-containing protein [Methanomassiliicoccaceae archaeon]
MVSHREKMIREFMAGSPFFKRNVSMNEVRLFDVALTHDSFANEEASRDHDIRSYERLEFLGDAIMDMIVCEHIYLNTELKEGNMTDMKKDVVCNKNISLKVSEAKMDIDSLLSVGEGHKVKEKNVIADNMRADAFEAILGAVYILYGLDEARRIVQEVFF